MKDTGLQLRKAGRGDAPALADLINRAFRVERFYAVGDRITVRQVEEHLGRGEFHVLEDESALAGCVYVELRGERSYVGLLSIDPARQHGGLGSRLLAVAEDRARGEGCAHMDMLIVNLRTELPPYYGKRGYVETGTAPFPATTATTMPCHFIRMSKALR
jgi:N-acetylglutamate synthase-like GNAT family acetyltransferase